MKKMIIIVIVLVVLLITLIIAKNIIAKSVLSAGVKAITGLRLSIQSINVGIFNTLIDIKEMRLYNPPGFPDKLMVNMPEIYIDYDLAAFLKKRVHLEEVRLNLKELIVVNTEKGELNLNALNVVKAKPGHEPAQKKAKEPEKKAKKTEIQIDELRLKIGKVIYRDYSSGTPPVEREFNINIDENYKDITNPHALTRLILVKALTNTTIGSLTNFDLGSLQQGLSGAIKGAVTLSKDAAQKVLETGKQTLEGAAEVVGQTLEGVTETIKEIIPPEE